MSRKAYPLRINPEVLNAVQRWASDDLRSVNAQIEYLLRDALLKAGRVKFTEGHVVVEEGDEVEGEHAPINPGN